MGPMGVLLTIPSRSCDQAQVPVEAAPWGPLPTLFKYASIQPRHVEPTSQGGRYQEGVGNATHNRDK
jgi:hypothetical protein